LVLRFHPFTTRAFPSVQQGSAVNPLAGVVVHAHVHGLAAYARGVAALGGGIQPVLRRDRATAGIGVVDGVRQRCNSMLAMKPARKRRISWPETDCSVELPPDVT